MKQATFDPAKDLTLYFRCNRAGSKNFVFTYIDGSAYSFVYDELELHIYKNQGAKKKLISLTHVEGITLSQNTVTVEITKAQSNIQEGEYYWELYRTDLEKTWLCGDAIFHNGKFDGVDESTETITIDIDGDDVNITVQDASLINTRVRSTTSTATLTPNVSLYDMDVITAQAEALVIANPTGTPGNGNAYVVRVKDNATARAISFGNKYRAIGAALPTTTTISKTLYIAFSYNSLDDKYDVLPSQEEQ